MFDQCASVLQKVPVHDKCRASSASITDSKSLIALMNAKIKCNKDCKAEMQIIAEL